MSQAEFDQKTAELEGLLNNPEVRLDPHRVWALAQELKTACLHPTKASRPATDAGSDRKYR
ncbi:MAG: peptide chain release factor 1 [Alphaproteobacteria bacterium]|jgi:hypothetical protein